MKTAISLSDDLFERVERAAAESGMSRSAFFVAAAEAYLREQEGEALTARINDVIARIGQPSEGLPLPVSMQWLKDESW